jgi:hypothetical protein
MLLSVKKANTISVLTACESSFVNSLKNTPCYEKIGIGKDWVWVRMETAW